MHFASAPGVGPSLPARQDLFKLLASKAIEKSGRGRGRSKKISHESPAERHRADGRDRRRFLHRNRAPVRPRAELDWNRLYQGINVTNAERVRQLAQDGHEIVMCPATAATWTICCCPMLYHQAWCRHIAAGINLNFWPAGPIFRRLGAFFIRRTFWGTALLDGSQIPQRAVTAVTGNTSYAVLLR